MEKQIEEMAVILSVGECTDCKKCDYNDRFNCPHLYHAELLYNAGFRKQTEGEWIITERQCIITCSECGYRLELCYPDGTEVRSLPACPICGVKMKGGR